MTIKKYDVSKIIKELYGLMSEANITIEENTTIKNIFEELYQLKNTNTNTNIDNTNTNTDNTNTDNTNIDNTNTDTDTNINNANKKKKSFSKEHREKISNSMKAYHANKSENDKQKTKNAQAASMRNYWKQIPSKEENSNLFE